MINFKPTLAKADKTYRDLDYSGFYENLIQKLFYYTLHYFEEYEHKNTVARRTQFVILRLLKIMHCAQLTD